MIPFHFQEPEELLRQAGRGCGEGEHQEREQLSADLPLPFNGKKEKRGNK